MSHEETQPRYSGRLTTASELRAPRRDPDESPKAFVERLLDYNLDTAFHQGELEEERLLTYEALGPLIDRWDGLEGWEPFRKGKTDSSREEAKATLDPELAHAIKVLGERVKRLTEQIERLERDAQKISRAYTMYGGS